jgi:hypothetical protein
MRLSRSDGTVWPYASRTANGRLVGAGSKGFVVVSIGRRAAVFAVVSCGALQVLGRRAGSTARARQGIVHSRASRELSGPRPTDPEPAGHVRA